MPGDAPPAPSRLCVGIALTQGPGEARERLDAFCRALADATGMPVTGQGLWRYDRLLDGMDAGEIDLAWLPPVVALRAMGRRRVLPIAIPIRSGASSYATALFTPKESRFRALSDLEGARVAWVDRQSAAGYLIIRAWLRSRGLDFSRAFASEQLFGSHEAVAQAVLEGRADVGATFVYFDPPGTTRAVRHAGWGAADVRILAHAGPIPSDVVAASVRLPAAISRAVQRALLGPESPALREAAAALLGAEGFVLPDEEHLEPLSAMMAGDAPGR